MRDNPLHRQVFGAEEARLEPLLANAFARLLRGQMEAGCVLGAYEDDVLLGVAAMVPPDHCQPTLRDKLGMMRILARGRALRSEEHTSELQQLMHVSYAVLCLKKNIITKQIL